MFLYRKGVQTAVLVEPLGLEGGIELAVPETTLRPSTGQLLVNRTVLYET